MSLESLRAKLEELKQKRVGKPTSLATLVHRQTHCPRRHIYVPDPHMNFPGLEEVKAFLYADRTDILPYIKDKFDCDNFSLLLHSNAMMYSHEKGENWAFGNCESNLYGGHRFNLVMVKPHGTVYYIDPQTDMFIMQPGKFKFILF